MKCAKFQYNNIDLSKIQLCLCVLIFALLSGCASQKSLSRYTMKQDTAPNFEYGEIYNEAVVPRYEKPNRWNSRPYKIKGIQYIPLTSAKGHEEVGQASWYGQKFHGHKTANGEVFDMLALTAAHKTLPLPSFVRVTNLQNGKKVIVRVNDRGPFHGDRVLDLSYGAAKQLDFHSYGVTDIKMEVIHVSPNGDMYVGKNQNPFVFEKGQLVAKAYSVPENSRVTTSGVQLVGAQPVLGSQNADTTDSSIFDSEDIAPKNAGLFVQVMAVENGETAQELATGLSKLLQVPTSLPKFENIYKLQLGPLASEQKAQSVIEELKKIGFEQAFAIEVML